MNDAAIISRIMDRLYEPPDDPSCEECGYINCRCVECQGCRNIPTECTCE